MFAISDYYADLSIDLAKRFVTELISTLQDLCDEPQIGSLRYAHLLPDHSLRCWHLNHFPFIVFYRLDQSGLTVIRILHERRNLGPGLMAI